MTEYDLSDCGLQGLNMLSIEGVLTKVRIVAGAPILFMLDEHHTTPACIKQNIQNTQVLINGADVQALYVESHKAGEAASQLSLVSANSVFADHFIEQCQVVIEGVENKELHEQQHIDVAPPLWNEITVRSHPYDRARSLSFIASVFRNWRSRGMTGNAVLNMGGHHADDICDWIALGALDSLSGVSDLSYLRIRPTAHPP